VQHGQQLLFLGRGVGVAHRPHLSSGISIVPNSSESPSASFLRQRGHG
jgi:hypothetical protein